jgi:hypothetical protein
MNLEIVEFAGRPRNVRLVCRQTEMLVTLDIGPRVISYGKVGGPNLFYVDKADEGMPGGAFRCYGGHRVWIAPEEAERTLQPDNDPVEVREDDGFLVFTSKPDVYHTQKELRIRAEPELDRFVVDHRIYNHSPYPLELAVWGLTQLGSGETIFPQPAFLPHTEFVEPARPLVMWHYTRFADPRWTWGDRVVRLRHDPGMGPQKIGALIREGYAACATEGSVLLKRFAYVPGAAYADHGCNFETFTRHDILEIETLGPLVSVPSGGFAEHRETWYLIPDQTPPAGDTECGDWLESLTDALPGS